MDNTTEITDTTTCVLDSATLLATPSSPQKVSGKNKGLCGKIPVTLAQPRVQIYVEAKLRLPEAALAVTNVSKSVVLTCCQLLPTDEKKSAKLLLNGYVRNTVQFAVPDERSTRGISGDIRFSTYDIPFKCFAKVDYVVEPEYCFNESTRVLQNADVCYNGADTSEYTFLNSQFLNEKIHVQLVESKVREVDLKNDVCDCNNDISRPLFRTLNECMVVDLVLRVVQNQMVEVPCSSGGGGSGSGGSGGSGSSNGGGGKNDNDGKGDKSDKGDKDDKCDKDDKDGKGGKNDKDDKCDKDDKGNKCHSHDKDEDCDKHDKDDDCDKHDKDNKYFRNDKDDDFSEIGELKLSIPSKLLVQLKNLLAKSK